MPKAPKLQALPDPVFEESDREHAMAEITRLQGEILGETSYSKSLESKLIELKRNIYYLMSNSKDLQAPLPASCPLTNAWGTPSMV